MSVGVLCAWVRGDHLHTRAVREPDVLGLDALFEVAVVVRDVVRDPPVVLTHTRDDA